MNSKKIIIRKSNMADSRTCDFSQVSKETLLNATQQHISDVRQGMGWFIEQLIDRAKKHDFTKIKYLDDFYSNFRTNFQKTDWYELHKGMERHHIGVPEGQREDIDLIDVIEFIVDTVVAGVARKGQYYHQSLSPELLDKAFKNTVQKFLDVIELQSK